MCETILCFQHAKNSQKLVKNQKSTEKHLSFDGFIQEDIDLSDIYLAVLSRFLKVFIVLGMYNFALTISHVHCNEIKTSIKIELGM